MQAGELRLNLYFKLYVFIYFSCIVYWVFVKSGRQIFSYVQKWLAFAKVVGFAYHFLTKPLVYLLSFPLRIRLAALSQGVPKKAASAMKSPLNFR